MTTVDVLCFYGIEALHGDSSEFVLSMVRLCSSAHNLYELFTSCVCVFIGKLLLGGKRFGVGGCSPFLP